MIGEAEKLHGSFQKASWRSGNNTCIITAESSSQSSSISTRKMYPIFSNSYYCDFPYFNASSIFLTNISQTENTFCSLTCAEFLGLPYDILQGAFLSVAFCSFVILSLRLFPTIRFVLSTNQELNETSKSALKFSFFAWLFLLVFLFM